MSSPSFKAAQRVSTIKHHMMSSTSTPAPEKTSDEAPVLFKSDGSLRAYILNRPDKLNALNEPMLRLLRSKIEEWSKGDLPGVIVGTGVGRAFCSGGDVATVVEEAANPDTLAHAIDFFRLEYETDYILAAMPKPYVAIMDGITMGGGVGLSIQAPFRIATENTLFAMPETKIGFCPDVGASYFLSRLDGQLGTYIGLTGTFLKGRAVYEHGFATHFVPARRIAGLLERLAALEHPTYAQIDSTIDECRAEQQQRELSTPLSGPVRAALDAAFAHDTAEAIVAALEDLARDSAHEPVRAWARETLDALALRSPTSLKVALAAVRRGRRMSLLEALQMEMNLATAFCHGVTPDFRTGVQAVLVAKAKSRPAWSPASLAEVSDDFVAKEFFSTYSPEQDTAPALQPPAWLAETTKLVNPMLYALPTEEDIGRMVAGSHNQSGSTQITLEELLAKFAELKKGKEGVREKILDVVARRCTTEGDKRSPAQYLKWIH
ncbi:3-hydroxyisobutyryl-coenzyme A hydrolase [Amylocystis lapponica]|nr:3-hydroxyisobutyryl-coenzyme A hydrolase [Amylocystis lapponica]